MEGCQEAPCLDVPLIPQRLSSLHSKRFVSMSPSRQASFAKPRVFIGFLADSLKKTKKKHFTICK